MTAPINCQLIGRWRIVEADLWDTTDHWKSSSHTISATRPSSKPFAPLLQQPARSHPVGTYLRPNTAKALAKWLRGRGMEKPPLHFYLLGEMD